LASDELGGFPAPGVNARILLSRIFQGTIHNVVFEDYIEEAMCQCGTYPEPNLVLVMDNAFHRSERIEKLCHPRRVRLLYLPPITRFESY
jgi:hypothetical protein